MSFSVGIVGLPNVGKSTIFNALTKSKVDASNYPFCTIDPNVGVVSVPVRYLHSPSSIAYKVDIENSIRLVSAVLEEIKYFDKKI